jgi:hypothetical protein
VASLQEQADAAYRAYRQAAEAAAAARANPVSLSAVGIAESNLARAVAASHAANDALRASYQPPAPPTGGGGGGNNDTQNQINNLQAQIDALNAQRAAAEARERAAASSFLTDILRQYNMNSLAGRVDQLVREWGTSTEVIAEKLRQTNEYKERFKGLLALQQRGVTDVRNESQYLTLESNYRRVFREAGIQSYIGEAGSTEEQNSIADLVGKFSLSVEEVQSRVQDAQRVVTEADSEVRDALQRYYNVSSSDLVAYTLDPERTMNRINRIANAAIVGGYAGSRGLDIDLATAESVAGLAQEGDINTAQLSTDLTQSRIVRDATKRLADIEDTDLTDSEILQSELNLAPAAQRKVKALQSRERARFSGQSAIDTTSLMRNRSI